MCAYGGMKQREVDYWETYASVVNWVSIIAMLTLSIFIELHTKSFFFSPKIRMKNLTMWSLSKYHVRYIVQ